MPNNNNNRAQYNNKNNCAVPNNKDNFVQY